jgi:septum formation protein
MDLILASSSKYRATLLKRLGIKFKQISANIDEDKVKHNTLSPLQIAQSLALIKAQDVFNTNHNSLCIGSDQVVAIDNKILGKPGTKGKAIEQLKLMSAKTHQLITSVALVGPETRIEFTDTTTLKMRCLSELEIEAYVNLDLPLDCAGSYKLEESGIALFEDINSKDQSAITGLPLIKLTTELRKLGFKILGL